MPTLRPVTDTIGLKRSIARHCGIRVGLMKCVRYADVKSYIDIAKTVRYEDEHLQNTLCSPVNSIELILALASSVTLVLPYLAYGRQEKHAQGTRATLSRCIASVLSRSIVAMDLHSSNRHVFFDVSTPPQNMRHAEYLPQPGGTRCIARVSPDAGFAMGVIDTIHHLPRDLGPSARVLGSACVKASMELCLPFRLRC